MERGRERDRERDCFAHSLSFPFVRSPITNSPFPLASLALLSCRASGPAQQTLSSVLRELDRSFLGCTSTRAEGPVNEIQNRIHSFVFDSEFQTGPSALVPMQTKKDLPNSCDTLERVCHPYPSARGRQKLGQAARRGRRLTPSFLSSPLLELGRWNTWVSHPCIQT